MRARGPYRHSHHQFNQPGHTGQPPPKSPAMRRTSLKITVLTTLATLATTAPALAGSIQAI